MVQTTFSFRRGGFVTGVSGGLGKYLAGSAVVAAVWSNWSCKLDAASSLSFGTAFLSAGCTGDCAGVVFVQPSGESALPVASGSGCLWRLWLAASGESGSSTGVAAGGHRGR